MNRLLLKKLRAVDETTDCVCDILIEDGVIADMSQNIEADADRVIDCEGLTAIPSLFDMHVHLRDPGYTHKEDVLTACASALAGGITGAAAMPNTNPPADSADIIKYVTDKAAPTGVKIYQAGCITKGMQGGELTDFQALKDAGAILLSDDGRPVKNAELMRRALEMTNSTGQLIVSHCEDLDIINGGIINKGKVSQALDVKGMDRASEDSITAREIMLAASCDARIHICHVSTRGSIEAVRAAKAAGVKVSCETAPHYFFYTEDKLLSRDADYRMNPPLREQSDIEAIKAGILDGTVDCIITDHAPHAKDEKADFIKAPNGVVGLETSLAATLTALYHTGLVPLKRIVSLMSANPRRLLCIPVERLAAGAKANIAIIDTEKEWTVDPQKLHSKSKNSVFKGETLRGKVIYTIADGLVRYENEE